MDIILIPGLWLDGASWDDVLPVLQEARHRTHPLTLPGMESRDADRSRITLRDHIDATVAAIRAAVPDGSQVVLVGHSGGAAIAHGATDAAPDLVARVVYVDAVPNGDGGLINDELPAANGEIPLPDWALFDDEDLVDLDDQLRAEFRARAVPSPEHVATDQLRLSDERRYSVPVTVIACEFPSEMLREWLRQGSPYVRELGRIRDVSFMDLPTGHWPQFTRPKELGQAILAAAGPA
jgi:pimeloyl-ACP methyl ester carboxylesterase